MRLIFVPSVTGNALQIGIVSAGLSALGPSSKLDHKRKVSVGQVMGAPRCQGTWLDSKVAGQLQGPVRPRLALSHTL